MSDSPERFFNVNEAAAFLSVSKHFLYKWIDQVPHYRIGSKLAFRASELSAWAETRRVQPDATGPTR
jgi:excisionase family DNA binding protein